MFRPEPPFAKHLERLFDEGGWKNPHQTAMDTGVHYSLLRNSSGLVPEAYLIDGAQVLFTVSIPVYNAPE